MRLNAGRKMSTGRLHMTIISQKTTKMASRGSLCDLGRFLYPSINITKEGSLYADVLESATATSYSVSAREREHDRHLGDGIDFLHDVRIVFLGSNSFGSSSLLIPFLFRAMYHYPLRETFLYSWMPPPCNTSSHLSFI